MARSSISTYCNEWNSLFNGSSDVVLLDNLKRVCIEGRLQGSRFRSVCWRLLLGCLPCQKTEWDSAVAKWRARFDELKNRHDVDPHRSGGPSTDLQYNNPLSLDAKNPWQQYFDDAELKACIKQDVERTFPELEYFQSQSVREMMINILFFYARENPHISYKQGMHEILGPLIFVLFFDHETFEHASKEGGFEVLDSESRRLLTLLTDEKHLEHDAYEMFTQIMLIIQPWYYFADEHQPPQDKADEQQKKSKRAPSADAYQRLMSEPFARIQDSCQSNVLVRKLNWIGDTLVKHSDPQLYNHLEKLDIPPQIYGIRWLRLLFGREFPIQDLLFLWDAIFADGPPFALVDYIFVAMLVFIRDLLLECDYTGCLHYLMRYPPVTDVNRLLAVALHLQSPQKHAKPFITSMQTNFSSITVTGRPHPNLERRAEIVASRAPSNAVSDDQSSFGASVNKTLGLTIQKLNKAGAVVADILEPSGSLPSRIDIPVVNTVDVKKPNSRQQGQRPQQQRPASFKGQQRIPQQRTNGVPAGASGGNLPMDPAGLGKAGGLTNRKGSMLSDEEVELLKEQISCLQMRLSDVEQASHFVAEKLVGCADALSTRLASLNIPVEDEAHRTVASMRQMCRILNGTESISTLFADGVVPNMDGFAAGQRFSPSYQRANVSSESNSSVVTMVMDGFNTPVEIGNDPTRTLSDLESPHGRHVGIKATSTPQNQRPSQKQGTPVSRNPQQPRTAASGTEGGGPAGTGARYKTSPTPPSTSGARPRLGSQNELKEISRPKAGVSSSGDH